MQAVRTPPPTSVTDLAPALAHVPGLVDQDLGARPPLAPVPEGAKDEELDRSL